MPKRKEAAVCTPPYIFGLKEQDLYAPDVILFWAACVAKIRGDNHPKVVHARELAETLARSRRNKLVKVPD